LRDRREDIAELVAHFLDQYNEQNDRYVAHIDPRALAALEQYDWPGNVRELQNYVERAVVMAPGDELAWDLLPAVVTTGRQPRTLGYRLGFHELAEELVHAGLGDAGSDADDIHSRIVDRVEREVIAQVLRECAGVQIKAASRLGINRNTLHKKLKQYGLDGVAE
jgi:DNA-binding NtrC family response regulator